jgi:hypothetical protein
MRAITGFYLALALLGAGWFLPATRAGTFTWTAGPDVSVPLLNTEDADAGVIQDGPTLWVQTSLYPNWYRASGTTLDNLVAQPQGTRDSSFTQPNGDDAYWTDAMWEAPNGTYYAIIHVEYDYAVPREAFLWKRRIGVATSTNQGATWTYLGDIITPSPNRPGAPTPTSSYQDFGCGDTYLFVDRTGGYFYLYYMTAWVNSATGTRSNQVMSVARCAISSLMAPSSWYKWSGGTWTQPGIGGLEDPVFAGTGYVAGAIFSGTDMSVVHFNTYLNEYVAIGHDTSNACWISTCTNITTQNWQPANYTFPQRLYWYNWPVDPVTNNPFEIGQTFRLYSSQADTSGVPTKYFTVTFFNGDTAPTTSLISPTEGAVCFTSNTINLVAAATANPTGSVASVQFFANEVSLGTLTAAPYTFSWPNVATGSYRCWVRVTDNLGTATDSAGVDITVTPMTYPLWKAANGIGAGVSDTAVQADGLSPLVSYALNITSAAGLPQPQISSGDLTLTYIPLRTDVNYLVESSPDLVNWSSNLVNQGTFALSVPVTASIPIQLNQKLFLRLQITYQ